MKFSLVVLSCGTQLVLNARPESILHEIEFGDEDNANFTEQSRDCDKAPARDDATKRCNQPGNHIYHQLLCKNCNFWRRDAHPWCKVQCCDNRRKTPHNKCECTPRGDTYGTHLPDSVHGANSPEKCCGRDSHGRPTVEGDKCGCGEVGTQTIYGSHGSRDCCSGTTDKWNNCLPRTCAKKGTPGKCCRAENDRTHPSDMKESKKCGCFHAGHSPNPNDKVGWENCCTGYANAKKNACGCLGDATKPLPDGATVADCCTGEITADKKHCKAATCSQVGVKITGGQHCCSGKDEGKTCACLASGVKVPKGATFDDCCSNRIKDGKCDWLAVGEDMHNQTDPKTVCHSGKADHSNKCRCVHKGADSEDPKACCSGGYLKDKMCGCVGVGDALLRGAQESNCCTKAAYNDVCLCGAPGAPVLGMMKVGVHCCSKETKKGSKFCGCLGLDSKQNVTEGGHCCGGIQQYDGHGCNCVQTGVAVGSWAHDQACCSGKVVKNKEGAHVCDKK